MIQLPNGSVWPWRWKKKKSKTGEDGSYQTVQAGHGEGRERKARLEKMVVTTQLRLALETEEERR